MDSDSEISADPVAVVPADQPPSPGVGAAEVVLIATWIGLIAGFFDVGFLVMNKRLIDHDFYRLGADFPWIIPSGVVVLLLVPALWIALFARIRGPIRPAVPVGLLSFLGFLDICSRLRLEMWASVIVCGGLAIQSARLVRPRRVGFLRLVRATLGLLAAILVATMFLTSGIRLWSEYRQRAALPPAAEGAERVVDRVGHGAGGQHEFVWIWPSDDTEPGEAGEPWSAVRPGLLDVVLDTAVPCEHAYRKVAS